MICDHRKFAVKVTSGIEMRGGRAGRGVSRADVQKTLESSALSEKKLEAARPPRQRRPKKTESAEKKDVVVGSEQKQPEGEQKVEQQSERKIVHMERPDMAAHLSEIEELNTRVIAIDAEMLALSARQSTAGTATNGAVTVQSDQTRQKIVSLRAGISARQADVRRIADQIELDSSVRRSAQNQVDSMRPRLKFFNVCLFCDLFR